MVAAVIAIARFGYPYLESALVSTDSQRLHCPRSLLSFGPFRSDPHWHGTDPPATGNTKKKTQKMQRRRVEGTIRTRKTLPPEPPIDKMVRDRTHTPHTSNHHNESDNPELVCVCLCRPCRGDNTDPKTERYPARHELHKIMAPNKNALDYAAHCLTHLCRGPMHGFRTLPNASSRGAASFFTSKTTREAEPGGQKNYT